MSDMQVIYSMTGEGGTGRHIDSKIYMGGFWADDEVNSCALWKLFYYVNSWADDENNSCTPFMCFMKIMLWKLVILCGQLTTDVSNVRYCIVI